MNKELMKALETLLEESVNNEFPIMSIHCRYGENIIMVHIDKDYFPNGEPTYVRRDDDSYPWEKQITINNVMYYSLLRQKDYEKERGVA